MAKFIPINSTGRVSTTNSIPISTVLLTISTIRGSSESCKVAVHSLIVTVQLIAKAEPWHQTALFKQKMAQKEPEKNTPSTAANVIMRSAMLQWGRTI